MKPLTGLVAALAVIVFTLAAGLRPDAFYAGDPGVKLIAARQALAHPSRPLEVSLPQIGPDTFPFIEPFFQTHGDHAHAVTSELFPLLSAPLLRVFGLRGVYVLPAIGFLLAVASCGWLAASLDRRRNPVVAAGLAALATPWLFYGLEFWEHVPAIGLATLGTVVFLASQTGTRAPRSAVAFAAGVLFGIAILFRPETVCFLVAVIVGSQWLEVRPSWSTVGLVGLGVVCALIPLELYTVSHFNRLLSPHLGANSGPVGVGWMAGRAQLASAWLLPSGWDAEGPIRASSFWSVAPAIVLAFVPVPASTARSGRTFLWVVALVTTALVLLTAPNDGGGQWGPRYLLFAYVPLVVLAADLVEALPRRPAVLVALTVVALGSIWIQQSAYRQLRATKLAYGQVVDLVEHEVQPGGYLVTDMWWLDQTAAAATSERRLIFAATPRDGSEIMRRLSEATVPIVTLIGSRSESSDPTPWLAGTCYIEMGQATLPVRNLLALTLHHRCPGR